MVATKTLRDALVFETAKPSVCRNGVFLRRNAGVKKRLLSIQQFKDVLSDRSHRRLISSLNLKSNVFLPDLTYAVNVVSVFYLAGIAACFPSAVLPVSASSEGAPVLPVTDMSTLERSRSPSGSGLTGYHIVFLALCIQATVPFDF